MEAKLGSNPSWGWRSILEGRNIVKQGLLWQVGKGDKINVWTDQWVPSLPGFIIPQEKPRNCAVNKVSDLIDHDNQSWNRILLHQLFTKEVEDAILKIQVPLFPREDRRVWGASKDGRYSVKSAYFLQCKPKPEHNHFKPRPSRISRWGATPSAVWKTIWGCQTMPKIRTFLWRACAAGLATGEGFMIRHVNIDPQCMRCGVSVESPDHTILHCPFAKVVWFGSPLLFRVPDKEEFSLQNWIEGWLEWRKVGKKQFRELSGLCSFLAWLLWLARNAYVRGQRKMSLEEVIQAGIKAHCGYLGCLKESVVLQEGLTPPVQQSEVVWTTPTQPFHSICTDALWSPDHKRGGLGVVIKNYRGELIFAKLDPSKFDSMIIGEALAIRLGLLEAISEGLEFIKVESDNQQVINYLNASTMSAPLQLQSVLQDILHIAAYFSDCKFTFIPREANEVADSLARKALSMSLNPILKDVIKILLIYGYFLIFVISSSYIDARQHGDSTIKVVAYVQYAYFAWVQYAGESYRRCIGNGRD
ncbi:uncharacterized protein LOC122644075 [Telopea speciosissima]|uniref:uncharacterized protein LOC122644075 n=1 Tax=Telopea speciosissima TaxID=54955 RepID=UPI001CC4B5E2|nr:uncharacterized protein LOC122644075 [Telopea speciosissima]